MRPSPTEGDLMDFELSPVEARIIGALMEKEKTTPENNPLTLNAVTRACSQKSNRNPAMNIDESLIAGALDGLGFHKQLTKRLLADDSLVHPSSTRPTNPR